MGYASLQECVRDLERTQQLVRIEQEIDPYLEAAEIQRRVYQARGPALLFTHVKGSRFPMVCNLFGTMERTRVIDAVREVMRYTGHKAEIEFQTHMPVGPLNRVADNALAKKLLDWEPQVAFMDGLRKTADWYFADRDRTKVAATLDRMLTERLPA